MRKWFHMLSQTSWHLPYINYLSPVTCDQLTSSLSSLNFSTLSNYIRINGTVALCFGALIINSPKKTTTTTKFGIQFVWFTYRFAANVAIFHFGFSNPNKIQHQNVLRFMRSHKFTFTFHEQIYTALSFHFISFHFFWNRRFQWKFTWNLD